MSSSDLHSCIPGNIGKSSCLQNIFNLPNLIDSVLWSKYLLLMRFLLWRSCLIESFLCGYDMRKENIRTIRANLCIENVPSFHKVSRWRCLGNVVHITFDTRKVLQWLIVWCSGRMLYFSLHWSSSLRLSRVTLLR